MDISKILTTQLSLNNFDANCTRFKLHDDDPNLDGSNIKVTFLPKYYLKGSDDSIPIDANESIPIDANESIGIALYDYIQTERWKKDLIEYTFNDIFPDTSLSYTTENYYLDNVSTNLMTNYNHQIIIVISGTLRKYDYSHILRKHLKNSTFNKNQIEPFSRLNICDIYSLVTEAFHKSTNDGEIFIPDIGRLDFTDIEMQIDITFG